MNKLFSLCLALLLLLVVPQWVFALDVPALQGRVNDYASLLSPVAVQQLERQLADLERSDSTQVVILTIPSLEGEDLAGFAIRVAEAWKIGQKGLDNGAILLIAKAERKIRIEVGRGLEGKLTDLAAGRIIRGVMSPHFKAGDYDGGVMAGVAALAAVVKGEYKAQPRQARSARKGGASPLSLLLGLVMAVVVMGAVSRVLGGVAGAVGAPVIASLVLPALSLWVLLALGIAGFVLGLLLAALFAGGGGGFGSGPYFGGWYGGEGGGGDSGFSGGGGDFGGGGASGDW